MSDKKPIELAEGWAFMEKGIQKLVRLLEGEQEDQFNAEQYMHLYTTIYNMCTQKPPHDYSEELYTRYKGAFNKYITDKVMPSLQEHRDEVLLRELLQRWNNHKLMVRWLSRFFNYLDRYYVLRHSLHPLKDVGLLSFKENVYDKMKEKARDAVLKLVEREREGELIDRPLIKNILGIFLEVGMGSMDCYEKHFEEQLLSSTAAYYKLKASQWIEQDSCPDYMLKAEEERVDVYLHASTKSKLLKEVETELLANYEQRLLTKEHSGCAALLRDDKTDDLARMYRLFQRVPKGLEPVSEIFREHVEGEGNRLVKDVTEAMEDKRGKENAKAPTKDSSSTAEQQFVRHVIELHDKYVQYVSTCFCNSSLFHKALKEAFEAFCNKTVAGSSSAELMASFCDNLLKKTLDWFPISTKDHFDKLAAKGEAEKQAAAEKAAQKAAQSAGKRKRPSAKPTVGPRSHVRLGYVLGTLGDPVARPVANMIEGAPSRRNTKWTEVHEDMALKELDNRGGKLQPAVDSLKLRFGTLSLPTWEPPLWIQKL